MKTPTTQRRVMKGAWPFIAAAIMVESASNALRGYALGSHLEAYTLTFYGLEVNLAGALLVLSALVVSVTQSRTMWVALTPGDWTQRMICAVIAALCLAVSWLSMASHIQDAQRTKAGAETQDSNAYQDAKAIYAAAAADFERVKGSPSLAEVEADYEAAIKKAAIDPNIWRKTKGCTEATQRASIDECSRMPNFSKQRAAARLKEDLGAKLPVLKADMERHKLKGEATAEEQAISGTWAWLLGMAIVIVATFGPRIFSVVVTAEKKPENTAKPIPGIPAIPPQGGKRRGRKPKADVVSFASEFKKRHGRSPSGSEIRANFPDIPTSTAYDYAKRA